MEGGTTFRELSVGDVFKFGNDTLVKVSADYDTDLLIPNQLPNSLRLSNTHYCIVHPDAKVYLIKSRYRFSTNL